MTRILPTVPPIRPDETPEERAEWYRVMRLRNRMMTEDIEARIARIDARLNPPPSLFRRLLSWVRA